MVSCKLMGGLGNQMFQIAATISYGRKNVLPYGFHFESCYTPNQGNWAKNYQETIYRNLPILRELNFQTIHNEVGFCYNEIPYYPHVLLNGYFQSEKYFEENNEFIKNIFVLPKPKADYSEYTSVHIRRGDYLKVSNFHHNLGLDYYDEAMSRIGGTKFIFFSDDMEWVKQNFVGEDYLYSDGPTELWDMAIMSKCKNNIIANSSFSWWGAYLNDNPNKIIIAPNPASRWFGPSGPKDTQDIIPGTWIKI